jgi:hypothetical protein
MTPECWRVDKMKYSPHCFNASERMMHWVRLTVASSENPVLAWLNYPMPTLVLYNSWNLKLFESPSIKDTLARSSLPFLLVN